MKIEIIYKPEIEKVFIKIDEEEMQEIDYNYLFFITKKVLDEGIGMDVSISGFDNAPDIGENYKEMFENISKLKEDTEIIELKQKLSKASKNEE